MYSLMVHLSAVANKKAIVSVFDGSKPICRMFHKGIFDSFDGFLCNLINSCIYLLPSGVDHRRYEACNIPESEG